MAALEPITTLITGAAGFLGWHVTRLLARHVESVRVLVRPTSQTRAMEGLNVDCVYGDLRDKASLANALEGVRQVFHVAADYRLWAKNPDEIYENNVVGTRNLLAASREAGVERFVYTSSVATIVVPAGERLPDERTAARLDQMIGHYKRSKFMAEQEVMEAAAKGFPAVVVNPTTPVGAGDWKPTPTGRIIVDFLNGRIPAYVDTGFKIDNNAARRRWFPVPGPHRSRRIDDDSRKAFCGGLHHFLFSHELGSLVVTDHLLKTRPDSFVRQPVTGGNGDGCDAARIDEPLNAGLPAGLEQVACSHDIVFVDLLRIFSPQPVIRGNMENLAHTFNSVCQRGLVAQISLNAIHIEAFHHSQLTSRAHQHTDAFNVLGKQQRDVPPEEARRSGNQRCYGFESCHLSSFQLSPNFRLAPKTADGS